MRVFFIPFIQLPFLGSRIVACIFVRLFAFIDCGRLPDSSPQIYMPSSLLSPIVRNLIHKACEADTFKLTLSGFP